MLSPVSGIDLSYTECTNGACSVQITKYYGRLLLPPPLFPNNDGHMSPVGDLDHLLLLFLLARLQYMSRR